MLRQLKRITTFKRMFVPKTQLNCIDDETIISELKSLHSKIDKLKFEHEIIIANLKIKDPILAHSIQMANNKSANTYDDFDAGATVFCVIAFFAILIAYGLKKCENPAPP